MDIDEFCAKVNRELRKRRISVKDGRTSIEVNPRNIRYYQSLGLVRNPVRENGRASYDDAHVEEVVAIKTAQGLGLKLEQLPKPGQGRTTPFPPILESRLGEHRLMSRNEVGAPLFSAMLARPMMLARSEEERGEGLADVGWSVQIEGITISGQGTPPTQEQIDRIAGVLRPHE